MEGGTQPSPSQRVPLPWGTPSQNTGTPSWDWGTPWKRTWDERSGQEARTGVPLPPCVDRQIPVKTVPSPCRARVVKWSTVLCCVWHRQSWVRAPNLHQCLQTCLKVHRPKMLGCHADLYTVGRCHTRGESEESVVCRRESTQARESTLALKPRAHITRSPKQGFQWPHKKDLCSTKILKKNSTFPIIWMRAVKCVAHTMMTAVYPYGIN